MSEVVPIPVSYRHKRLVSADEVWASPKPSDLMTWAVCDYTTNHRDTGRCSHCPASFEDPSHGTMTKGCRMLAEEACRVVMAIQRREANSASPPAD